MLFVEQNVQLALSLAYRGHILESGHLLMEGSVADVLASGAVKKVFLGL